MSSRSRNTAARHFQQYRRAALEALELAYTYLDDGALMSAATNFQKASGLLVQAQNARNRAMNVLPTSKRVAAKAASLES